MSQLPAQSFLIVVMCLNSWSTLNDRIKTASQLWALAVRSPTFFFVHALCCFLFVASFLSSLCHAVLEILTLLFA